MLTEINIEALLVDEELADQVWEAWAEYDQKLNGDTLNDDMPNEKTTIQ